MPEDSQKTLENAQIFKPYFTGCTSTSRKKRSLHTILLFSCFMYWKKFNTYKSSVLDDFLRYFLLFWYIQKVAFIHILMHFCMSFFPIVMLVYSNLEVSQFFLSNKKHNLWNNLLIKATWLLTESSISCRYVVQ